MPFGKKADDETHAAPILALRNSTVDQQFEAVVVRYSMKLFKEQAQEDQVFAIPAVAHHSMPTLESTIAPKLKHVIHDDEIYADVDLDYSMMHDKHKASGCPYKLFKVACLNPKSRTSFIAASNGLRGDHVVVTPYDVDSKMLEGRTFNISSSVCEEFDAGDASSLQVM